MVASHIRFRVPLHAEMAMTDNCFNDTVRSMGGDFKAVGAYPETIR